MRLGYILFCNPDMNIQNILTTVQRADDFHYLNQLITFKALSSKAESTMLNPQLTFFKIHTENHQFLEDDERISHDCRNKRRDA